MISRSITRPGNKRAPTNRRRKNQHILDVTVRSRKATEQRIRKVLEWFCWLVLIGTAGGAIYVGGREALRRFVWENKDYEVAEVRFETDGGLTREQVVAASGINQGVNIFRINLAEARRSLLALSPIETAEITRTLPNKIAINITERKPVAWLAPHGVEDPSTVATSFLTDQRGVLIPKEGTRPEYLHLPVIYGAAIAHAQAGETIDTPEMRAALDLLRLNAENTVQFQVRSVDISKGYCLVVNDRNHARITFGLDRLDWQLERLSTVLNHVEQTKQELQTVNLMVERNVPVTFAPVDDPAREAQVETPEKPAVAPKKADLSKPANQAAKASAALPVPKAGAAKTSKPAAKSPLLQPFHKPVPAEKKKPVSSTHRNG